MRRALDICLPVCGLWDQARVIDNSSGKVDLDSFFFLLYFKHDREVVKEG
jgi:hypothetical protein